MNTISKKDMVNTLSSALQMSKKDCSEIYDTVFQTIADYLVQGNEISIIGFGSFKLPVRAERSGVNALRGEKKEYVVPAHRVVSFKPSANLKAAVADLPIEE